MKENLKRYVDRLFAGQEMTEELADRKEEVLSNMDARLEDYLAQGLTGEEAFRRTVRQIDSIAFLLPGVKRVDRYGYAADLAQTALLYALLVWVATVPSRLLGVGLWLHHAMLLASGAAGAAYLILLMLERGARDGKGFTVRLSLLRGWEKKTWMLAGLALLLQWGMLLGVRFGSSLWFGRPLSVSGPYQAAVLGYSLALPLACLLLPLLVRRAVRLADQHEAVGE
ncbi:hypothetical protein J31TS4_20920 [Paenibacillus sp. J31TS4]|uniref:permease prefix domain 1-containing protein n=1 Tax=Paenibacillus sp. J31TS4 TaxID=2807195 RepID=UPI001B0D27E9|nr:permease prefix domain 1-containing protein [Paenibacillus sp. J31TS4]GIP38812.1 hypothetical protein J31TS4_20920 [Paenibacillus sp. J31TS4]